MLAMIAVAAAAVSVPLLRARAARPDPTGEIVRSQFVEAETDPQAARRLLAEAPSIAAPEQRSLGRGARFTLVGSLLFILVLGTVGLYLAVGAPELAGAPSSPAPTATGGGPDLTAELEQRALSAPGDATSWNRLGVAYVGANRFSDAAMVFARAATLDPNTSSYPSAEGEAMTQAAQGQVTPGARAAFRAALTADPSDPRARYYLALAKDQAGDHKGAMDDWVTLIRGAPTGAPWLPEVRAYVERAAKRDGGNLETRLRVQSGNQ